jgi:hypothetical protein
MTHQSRTTQSEGKPSMDDIDAELFGMINDEQLRDNKATPPKFDAGVPADVRACIWRGSPC